MIPPKMRRQLEILGYTDNSKVRVRCFTAKGMPLDEQVRRGMAWQKDEKTIIPIPVEGWLYPNGAFVRLKKKRCGDKVELDSNGNPIWIKAKSYRDGIAYLRSLNSQGYGVYLIPNEGGGADADINRFPALFYECDGVAKDEQWQKLRSLESKLERSASMVVETRNSLHAYLKLDYDKLLPSTWTQYQQRLIQAQESDPAIWNPARLMRLAGFDHQKWNSETNSLEQFPVRLVQHCDSIFTLDEFENVLPEWASDRWSRTHQTSERVATNPTDNPGDIRKFAPYLDGHKVDGRQGWDTAKCPAHNGQSDNSLHIEQSTGAYKCHSGCAPKDVYRAALEQAQSRGYQLPENFQTGQKSVAHPSWLNKFRQHLALAASRSGWGVDIKGEVAKGEIVLPKILAVIYGDEAGERLNTWTETLKQSKYILDTSATGTGKSFDAGTVTPELFGASQVIYVSSEHRNPTTPTLKSWADLEARHKGLTRDEFGKLRRAKSGQPYVIRPNCSRIDTISALRSKNIGGADTSGLICKTCHNRELCQAGAVDGYLYDRAKSLRQPRLRAHPQSLPDPGEYDYSDVVFVWDESAEILKSHRSLYVTANDVTRAIAKSAIASPELFDALRPVLTALHPYLCGQIKTPYYGWKDEFIRTALPQVDVDIDALRSHLEVDFDKLLNSTQEYGVDLGDLPRNVRKRFADSDAHLSEEINKNVSLNWLPDFVTALGSANSNLAIGSNGTLTITLPDQRLADIAAAASGNIFLDATGTAADLAPALGIEPKEILTISQAIPDTSNLEIIQIATLGRLGIGNDRTEFCQGRVDALINQIKADTSGKVAVFDFKRNTQLGDGKRPWWTGTRGVNDVEDCKAAILVGVPTRNLGELEAEFKVLYGRAPEQGTKKVKHPVQIIGQPSLDLQPFFEMNVSVDQEFNEFCRRRIQADIRQAIGRLRAHRRPGEQLRVYFIADYPLDVPVTLRRAADITPEAASKVERVELAIIGAVRQLKDAGQKITQGAIAQIVGVSQGYISRFRELLQTLLDPSYRESNNFSDYPPNESEVQWMGQEYLPILAQSPPDELLEEVLSVFENYGAVIWRQVWDATPAAAQVKILQVLMFTLTPGELRLLPIATAVKT
ncbi:hypothetical protein [Chlorogloea sp. CCALA 695]|uniref:hypothetical protein n=1 Tax=Chlorogloea sp. CCALA 695 TaxID=2107693 RepID=UPI000D0638A7|nr:hypothetical protein [Chlorogloea sp. CCALA 695]PSB28689.1 hypothetical protein C7B70_20465 [Chlorogloea sp. CCALA 695]